MAKARIIDVDKYQTGLRLLEDSADTPIGSARFMQNILISDRNGISKRPGTTLLGSFNPSVKPTKGFYVYKKAFGNQQIPVKAYDTFTEYFHATRGWTRLENGFTSGSEFGFKEHIRNIDNEDYLYMGNRTEAYRRWQGAYTQLNGAVLAGATSIIVDGVLKDSVYFTGTAGTNSSTTIQVAGSNWATDQWRNFYVLIKAGTYADQIRLISGNTADTLTFAALPGSPGNVAFDLRLLAFPASGTLVIENEEITYSAIPSQFSITTSALAGAHPDDSPVTVKPTAFEGAPKGNRLEVSLERMIVGNVAAAVSRDAGGAVQGSSGPLSAYVSKLRNASDFTFAATRVAGEGDIISFPEGDTAVVDIANQEENFYIFTRGSITAVQYSQDANDVAVKTPLKSGTGAVGRVIKGENDVYFVTPDKKISSIGRILNKDITPQVENIGLVIKRLTDTFNFDYHAGAKFGQRIFHAMRSGSDIAANDRTLVYNEFNKSYEGLWTLAAQGFAKYNDDLLYANAFNPNIYKMFSGTTDNDGSTEYAIESQWLSNWMNLTPSKANLQSVFGWFVEGFIWGGTNEIHFNLYSDYSSNPSLTFQFGIDKTQFLDDTVGLNGYFGGTPLGITPIGTLGSVQADGSRHFSFIFYFPFIYANFFSIGVSNNEKTAKFDIVRQGLAISEETDFAASRILNIN